MLTSGINFKAIEEHGSDDHPLALDWAGEFVKANRGIFEAVEFFKNPREFLYSFLSLAQERQFKIPKFGYISADIAIVAHTNESEYRAFMADAKNEALRDRLFTIAVPYSVRRSSETMIYDKLLESAQGRSALPRLAAHAPDGCHRRRPLAPGAARDPAADGQAEALRRRRGRRVEARPGAGDQAEGRARGHERARAAADHRRPRLGCRLELRASRRASTRSPRSSRSAPTSRTWSSSAVSARACSRSSPTRDRSSTASSRTRCGRRSSPPSPSAPRTSSRTT